MKFTVEDRLLSWWYLSSTVLITSASYASLFLVEHALMRVAVGVLTGLLMNRLFVIYHDYQHGAILRKSKPAAAFMRLFGILSLAPNSVWRETHNHHHHNNSRFSRFVVGSFPTISTSAFRALSRGQQIRYLVIRHPFMIAFSYIPIFLVSFCLWPFFENPRKYTDCGISAFVHLGIALWLYLYGGWAMLLYVLLIPSLFMYALGGYLFYAQHNFPQVVLRDETHWDYLDAALHSSSFIRMSPLMNWFTANIGYHHVHHVNSRIPFYRLPEAMRALPPLHNPGTTNLQPREILQCLKLKLWDEEKGRMVSIGEYRAMTKRLTNLRPCSKA